MDLGGSWAPFGRGLGRSGVSFGHSWASFACLVGRLESIRLVTLVQDGLQEPLGIDLGRVLGSIWEGFGAAWGLIRALLGRFLGRSKSSGKTS